MSEHLNNTLLHWSKKFSDLELVKPIKSGKEASVYLVRSNLIDKDNNLFALKIYKENHLKSSNAMYIQGKYFKERSNRRAVAAKNQYGKDLIQKLWTRREFYMLEKLYAQGISVPKVYEFDHNSIIMEYIGDLKLSAPKLKEVTLEIGVALKFYKEIVNAIKIFWVNGIVHGDLSEHNILYWQGKIYIIDFPQAIDVRKNENAKAMLKRDVSNINRYFEKYLSKDQLISSTDNYFG